jgi:hypothetical protein
MRVFLTFAQRRRLGVAVGDTLHVRERYMGTRHGRIRLACYYEVCKAPSAHVTALNRRNRVRMDASSISHPAQDERPVGTMDLARFALVTGLRVR